MKRRKRMQRAYAVSRLVLRVVPVAPLAAVAAVAAASGAFSFAGPAFAAGTQSSSSAPFERPASLAPVGDEAGGETIPSVPRAGGTTLVAASAADAQSVGITSVGTLRCTRRVGQQMRACRFRAIRRGGYTTVVVNLPGGGTRAIFFDPDGAVRGVARTASQTPTRMDMTARQRGDVMVVSVGAERFEVRKDVVARE